MSSLGKALPLPQGTTNFYLEYMYSKTRGFIARCKRHQSGAWDQDLFYNIDKIIQQRQAYEGVENMFTSMNTFLDNKNRTVNNLKRLNALWVDLDVYNTDLSKQDALNVLDCFYINKTIPEPTFIVDSGGGLYLVWKIDEDRNALPRWNRVQKYLFEQCENLGADVKSLDAARVLRIPTSINGKNGNTVSVVRFTNKSYSLHELIKKYDITHYTQNYSTVKRVEGVATDKQIKYAQKIAKRFKLDTPDFNDFNKTFNFISKYGPLMKQNKSLKVKKGDSAETIRLKRIVDDIFTLYRNRRVSEGSREYALFLCRLFVGQITGDYDAALSAVYDLNRLFDKPCDEKRIAVLTKSAESKLKAGNTYKYGNDTIIEKLCITSEEMLHLSYFNKNAKTAASRKESNRKAYEARLLKNGNKLKSVKIKERQERVAELIRQGKSRKEICELLHISFATYTKDKSAIMANACGIAMTNIKAEIKTRTQRLLTAFQSLLDSKKDNVQRRLLALNKSGYFFQSSILRENSQREFRLSRYIGLNSKNTFPLLI